MTAAVSSMDSVATKVRSVESGSSAQAVSRLLDIWFPDARSVLDMTYGSGNFWYGSAPVHVIGLDRNPERARDVCADFTALPFVDNAFDLTIFDPPYIADAGAASIMKSRFGSFKNVADMRDAVERGAREAFRVGRLGALVKVGNHTHGGKFVHMTRWVQEVMPVEVYGEMHLESPSKIEDGRWCGPQLSLRARHSTFLGFRKGSQIHRLRAVLDAHTRSPHNV